MSRFFMTLFHGSYATWIDTSAHGCIRSGFFQGIDGANRLVFATVNGTYSIDSDVPIRNDSRTLYTLVEWNKPKLSLVRDGSVR